MSKNQQIRPDVVRRALEEYRNGVPLKEIAEKAGVTSGTVCQWVRDAGIARRGSGRTTAKEPDKAAQEALKKLHTSTESFAVIGKQFGMTRQAANRLYRDWLPWVQQWAKSAGLPLERPKKAQEKKAEKKPKTILPESERLSVVISFRLSPACVGRLRQMIKASPLQTQIRSEQVLLQKLAINLAKQKTLPLFE